MFLRSFALFLCLSFISIACTTNKFDYTPKSKADHSYRQIDGRIIFSDNWKNKKTIIRVENPDFNRVSEVTITKDNIGEYNFNINDCVKTWVFIDTYSDGREWFIPLNQTISPCKN